MPFVREQGADVVGLELVFRVVVSHDVMYMSLTGTVEVAKVAGASGEGLIECDVVDNANCACFRVKTEVARV